MRSSLEKHKTHSIVPPPQSNHTYVDKRNHIWIAHTRSPCFHWQFIDAKFRLLHLLRGTTCVCVCVACNYKHATHPPLSYSYSPSPANEFSRIHTPIDLHFRCSSWTVYNRISIKCNRTHTHTTYYHTLQYIRSGKAVEWGEGWEKNKTNNHIACVIVVRVKWWSNEPNERKAYAHNGGTTPPNSMMMMMM